MNIKNPDDDINVATVEPCGTVRVWGPMYASGVRSYIRTQHFPYYGAGKLWADEYEDAQRQARPARTR